MGRRDDELANFSPATSSSRQTLTRKSFAITKTRTCLARAFNQFNDASRLRRQKKEDFARVFEDDPFNPDDAWGASRTNNVRPFFNFNKHADQWKTHVEDDSPHDESDFWFFSTANQASKKTKYYYHEYNYYHYHGVRKSRTSHSSHSSHSSEYNQQQLGRPDLQMARQAFKNATHAVASVASSVPSETDLKRAEERICNEIERAMQYAALDILVFARALDCDPSSAKSARRSIVMRFHPDKVQCVMGGDSDAEKARKRLEGMLGQSIVSCLSQLL